MKIGTLKGALLEHIVRNLFKNCGFTNVKADGVYSFESKGLFFVNGRGAAHDADVIVNPPIQMPFSYPTQLIFECKAYSGSAGLSVIRNAFGLRNDLNEFEIVTRDSIMARQNDRRAAYAVEMRLRFLYQVGVASINGFKAPAVEFATNNKIPLLSLTWFLKARTIDLINGLDDIFLATMPVEGIRNLYKFFKDRDGDEYAPEYTDASIILSSNNAIATIINDSLEAIQTSVIGLLETGDIIFLHAIEGPNFFPGVSSLLPLRAEIHWERNTLNLWQLTIEDPISREQTCFGFYLPTKIFRHWQEYNFDKVLALDMKAQFFSRIFIFNNSRNRENPFCIVDIDREWLDRAREQL